MPHTSRVLRAAALTACFVSQLSVAGSPPEEGALSVTGASLRRGGDAGREPCDDTATELEGPWGVLQAYHVYIAAPDFILQQFDVPSAVTRWTFLGMTRADVSVFFDEPDIPVDVRNELRDQSRWVVAGDQIQVLPSAGALLALPPEARARIYATLSRWEANEFHAAPYFVPCGDVRRWIGDTGLRPEIVDAVSRSAYPIGKSLGFSDVALLVSMTRSHSEAREVLQALSRTRTAILRLRLDTSSDVAKIRDYWSGGVANAKDFLPLLESVAANPDVRHIDLVHILPPNARKLCYTYPHPSLAVGGRYPDCHWTCLNFFNYRPEERLVDTDGAAMFVQEHYDPGEKPYRFGDVLFFTDPQGRAAHSCIYLAADFVYTKNGANVVNPWQIMRLQEVLDRYSVQGEPMVRIYRRR